MKAYAIQMALGLTAMSMLAAPATAGDFSFGLGISEGHGGSSFGLSIDIGRPRPVIVTPPVVRPVVVEPVYETVIERVWVPTTEVAYRDVPVIDALGNVVSYRREAYTVESGYWKNVERRVLVYPDGCREHHSCGHTEVIRQRAYDPPFNGHSTYRKGRIETRHREARTPHEIRRDKLERSRDVRRSSGKPTIRREMTTSRTVTRSTRSVAVARR